MSCLLLRGVLLGLASWIPASWTLTSWTLASWTLASWTLASRTLASFGSLVFGSRVSGSLVFGSRISGSLVFGSRVSGSLVFGSRVAGLRVAGLRVQGAHALYLYLGQRKQGVTVLTIKKNRLRTYLSSLTFFSLEVKAVTPASGKVLERPCYCGDVAVWAHAHATSGVI